MPKKLSVDEQKELIPDDSIRQAFLERKDIALLPPDEQEKEWQEVLLNINKFIGFLSGFDSYVVGAG